MIDHIGNTDIQCRCRFERNGCYVFILQTVNCRLQKCGLIFAFFGSDIVYQCSFRSIDHRSKIGKACFGIGFIGVCHCSRQCLVQRKIAFVPDKFSRQNHRFIRHNKATVFHRNTVTGKRAVRIYIAVVLGNRHRNLGFNFRLFRRLNLAALRLDSDRLLALCKNSSICFVSRCNRCICGGCRHGRARRIDPFHKIVFECRRCRNGYFCTADGLHLIQRYRPLFGIFAFKVKRTRIADGRHRIDIILQAITIVIDKSSAGFQGKLVSVMIE